MEDWRVSGDVVRRRRRRTRAGGVTVASYTAAAPVVDWRRRAAPVEDRSQRTSREPAAGVMDRRRSGQSSDSESGIHALLDWDKLPGRATRLE